MKAPSCRVQFAKYNLVNKTSETLSCVARNTSWSHGWLRWFLQLFFGAITVTSFILIVYMASNQNKAQESTSRCQNRGCRVICSDAPYFDQYEQDIVHAVTETRLTCQRVLLTLEHPMFENFTLPQEWMSRLPSNIYELEIIGGNLQYIAPQAFMSRFTRYIRRLSFEHITLMEWRKEMLFGLVELEEIVIKESNLIYIQSNALEAVDNTLKFLSVTGSGYWDPSNLTGTSNLEVLSEVILSSNSFSNIISQQTLSALKHCRVLYLNSCRIQAIGAGAFDSLININMIHLNNNFLRVLPAGIFGNLLIQSSPAPRINLQDNRWICDCSNKEMRELVKKGLLIVTPICSYPVANRGQSFTEFFQYCDEQDYHNSSDFRFGLTARNNSNSNSVYMYGKCGRNSIVRLVSPFEYLPCPVEVRNVNFFSSRSLKFNRKKPRRNELLWTNHAIKSDDCSLVEVSTTESEGFGLVWYERSCPDEIYCIATMPKYLRVYNDDEDIEYTFCPLNLSSFAIASEKCVYYNLLKDPERVIHKMRVIVYFIIGILCFIMGALIIYFTIRKFPNLLKGSKRILFVKHKNVEALILPPKIPLRSSIVDSQTVDEFKQINDGIFLLPMNFQNYKGLERSKSIRSTYSVAPSYISALQPTEDQLLEWRLKHHFSNDPICDDDGLYSSLGQVTIKTYESLK